MKFILIRVFFMMLILCFSFEANAALCQKKTAVVYSNGMFNSWSEANDSMEDMKTLLKQRLQSFPSTQFASSELKFYLAYASDKDGLGTTFKAQLLEVYYQKKGSLTESFWRSLAGIEASPPWFQNLMVSLAGAQTALTYVIDADFQSMLNGTPLASAHGKSGSNQGK